MLPGRESSSADCSERALGTFPPAHGLTEQSAFGFGQYDGRSTCADAVMGSASRPSRTNRLTSATRMVDALVTRDISGTPVM